MFHRMAVSLAVLCAVVGSVPAQADRIWSHSAATPCDVSDCAYPYRLTETWTLPAGRIVIDPYCTVPEADAAVCWSAVQGEGPEPPGRLGVPIGVKSAGEGATLSITACNNYTKDGINYCEGLTSVRVTISIPDEQGARVEVSGVCLAGLLLNRTCVEGWTVPS